MTRTIHPRVAYQINTGKVTKALRGLTLISEAKEHNHGEDNAYTVFSFASETITVDALDTVIAGLVDDDHASIWQNGSTFHVTISCQPQ